MNLMQTMIYIHTIERFAFLKLKYSYLLIFKTSTLLQLLITVRCSSCGRSGQKMKKKQNCCCFVRSYNACYFHFIISLALELCICDLKKIALVCPFGHLEVIVALSSQTLISKQLPTLQMTFQF